MDLEKIDGQLALTRTTTLSLDQEIAYWMRWGMDNIGNEDPALSQPLRIFSGYGGQEDNVRNKVIDVGEINQFQQQMRNLAVTYMNDGMALEIEELIGNDLIEFERVDLRVGTITEAEKVPKTNKLLKLSVDIGFETRTVVSGIAGSYDPENVVGKQVTLLINLEPRKIKGIESQGMILMAADQDDNLMFVNPDEEFVNGSEIG